MNTKINHITEFDKEIEIAVDWDEVREDYNDLLKRYMQVPVKGFRPGKIPEATIESIFKEELKNDLAGLCAKRFCRMALEEHGLEAASPIQVKEASLVKNSLFSFTVAFIRIPPFELPDYANLDLEDTGEDNILNDISEKLLAKTQIILAPSLIDQELNFSDVEPQNATEEDRTHAEERAKLMLILKKIAKQDGFEVSEACIQERLEQLGKENGLTAEEVARYFSENGGMERFSDLLLAEQVLQYIASLHN